MKRMGFDKSKMGLKRASRRRRRRRSLSSTQEEDKKEPAKATGFVYIYVGFLSLFCHMQHLLLLLPQQHMLFYLEISTFVIFLLSFCSLPLVKA